MAKCFDHDLHHLSDLVCLGYVNCDFKAFAIMGLYRPSDFIEWFGSNIRKCDMGAFTGKAPGDRRGNAACCAGNQGYFSIEFHNEPPKIMRFN